MNCPKCKKKTGHKHLRDAAHGISATHIAGSERFECLKCGYAMLKEEAEKQGLIFCSD